MDQSTGNIKNANFRFGRYVPRAWLEVHAPNWSKRLGERARTFKTRCSSSLNLALHSNPLNSRDKDDKIELKEECPACCSNDHLEPETLHETPTSDEKKKLTRGQKMTVVCIGLVNLSSFLSMSIIAPFFPKEATEKGMREAVSGFVFSVYALVMLIASPVFGKIIQHTGPMFMFHSGLFVAGSSNILFGSFEALGAAAFSTASYTIILDQFPNHVGKVFSILETCVGVGMSLGPAIGGWLYAAGGYGLPFFILGASVLLNIPLSWFMLEKSSSHCLVSDGKRASYRNVITIPLVAVVCIVIVVSSQAEGFIDPTLEPHLADFHLGSGIVGLLFLITSASYAIFSPAVGFLTGHWNVKYPVMLFGLILMTVSLLLMGPCPYLPLPEGLLWLNVLGITLLGIAVACALIPTFEAISHAGQSAGLADDIGTYSIVSGLWNAMCSLGEVTGPSLGGLLADFLDFPLAATVMAAFTLLAAALVLVAWLFIGETDPKKRSNGDFALSNNNLDVKLFAVKVQSDEIEIAKWDMREEYV